MKSDGSMPLVFEEVFDLGKEQHPRHNILDLESDPKI